LGKKPPVFTLADLPGYGHAIARPQEIKQWKLMTRDYLKNRLVMGLCCIMVDCTRGLCSLDKSLVRFLHSIGVPWQIVLTKADLVTTYELAQTLQLVQNDLMYVIGTRGRPARESALLPVVPVSASTGAGIKQLYQGLEKTAFRHTASDAADNLPPHAVREHKDAFLVRRKSDLERLRKERNR
jgi:GTP-binding protein